MSNELHVESFATFIGALALAASSVVQSAVGLLPTAGIAERDLAPIVEVDQRPADAHENVEAFHKIGDPHIYIYTGSATYKAAVSGNQQAIIKLASIIAHENVHVMQQTPHSADEIRKQEDAAYKTQINTLRRLNANPQTVQGVQQAMKVATNSTR
jgi:hypothetical protein